MAADHPSTPVSGETMPCEHTTTRRFGDVLRCDDCGNVVRVLASSPENGWNQPAPVSPADPTREEAPSASPGEAGEDELTERANRFMAALMDRRAYTDASIVSDLLVSVRALGSMARDWKAEADRRQYRLSSQSEEIARLREDVAEWEEQHRRSTTVNARLMEMMGAANLRADAAESRLARLREALQHLADTYRGGVRVIAMAALGTHSDQQEGRDA